MTTKIAISLPDELVADARAAVAAGKAPSLSAYIAGILAEDKRHRDWADFLAEMAAQGGTPTAEDHAWARRALGLE